MISYEELKKENEKLKLIIKNNSHKSKRLFRDILLEKTGYNIIKSPDNILTYVEDIAKLAINYHIENNNNDFKNIRINEAGNYMETILDKIDSNIIKPKNNNNKYQTAGYPDRELKDKAYIEVKLSNINNLKSTQRTFYTSSMNKITKELPHILICFIHKNGKLIDKAKVVCLYELMLDLKCEWWASNKKLYK